MKAFPSLCVLFLSVSSIFAAETGTPAVPSSEIAQSINALGLDLYRVESGKPGNLLLSPYSIASALAMTCAGADGVTETEMQRVLHLSGDRDASGLALQALAAEFDAMVARSRKDAAYAAKHDRPFTPIQFSIANRIFPQSGFGLKPEFSAHLQKFFASTVSEQDFQQDPQRARGTINAWVAAQTQGKITDLLPPGGVTNNTRLVLVNALYLRASWGEPFEAADTAPREFSPTVGEKFKVPTMHQHKRLGYARGEGYAVVVLPYRDGELQFVLLVPDARDGLAEIERKLTPAVMAAWNQVDGHDVVLYLPKFTLKPPTLPLKDAMLTLGMKTAFDDPVGSANFERIAPRRPNDYFYIDEVYHKTWLALDEAGTEAAAATAVSMFLAGSARDAAPPRPIEVHADHPFLFAIQHVPSGACLFLGRVVDPR
jgi:serpin B